MTGHYWLKALGYFLYSRHDFYSLSGVHIPAAGDLQHTVTTLVDNGSPYFLLLIYALNCVVAPLCSKLEPC